MTTKAIITPLIPYLDLKGNALQNGKIYFGTSGAIAEASPITVYWDRALTQPAAQPLRTLNGYVSRNGSPANVFIAVDDYSITAKTVQDVTLFNIISALASGFIDNSTTAPTTTIANKANLLQNTNFENNSGGLRLPAVVRAGDAFIDKFIAGASGTSADISAANGINTVTISAGSIKQSIASGVIGTLTLSWEGSSLARINSGSYAVSPIQVTATSAATVLTCEWSSGTVSKINLNYGLVAAEWTPGINYYLFNIKPATNIVYNGDMIINQDSVSIAGTSGDYVVDGFIVEFNSTFNTIAKAAQITSILPSSITDRYIDKALRVYTNVTRPTMGTLDYILLQQRIEGSIIKPLINQESCCLRFYAQTQTPGIYCASIRSPGASYSYVIEYNLHTANEWILIEKNITGLPTGVSFATDNSMSLTIQFILDSGTSWKTNTTDEWLIGNFLATNNQAAGATDANTGLMITGVEFTVGTLEESKAIPRSFNEELEICKRYYQKYEQLNLSGYHSAGFLVVLDYIFSVQMRVAPTAVFSNITYGNASAIAAVTYENHSRNQITVTATGNAYAEFDVSYSSRL